MAATLRVLIVEDSAEDTTLIVHALRRGGWDVTHQQVETAEAMRRSLSHSQWDLILSDYQLTKFSGAEALTIAKELAGDVPFILISGVASEDVAVEVMKAGADDYFSKGNFTRLVPAVERELQQAGARRESRKIEQELRKREAHLADALQLARVGTWHTEIQTGAAVWSVEACRIMGISPEMVTPSFNALLERLVPDDRVILTRLLEHPDTKQFSLDLRILRQDGEKQHINIRGDLVRDAEARPVEAAGTIQDISERKRAEEASRASEGQYRSLFEYAPDGILIADTQGYYLDANPSMCRLLGYTRDELICLHASDIVAPHEIEHIQPALNDLNADADHEREWQFRRKDGSVFAAEVVATKTPAGTIMAVIRDITQRKLAEAALAKTIIQTERVNRELSFQKFALDQHAIVAMTDRAGRITYVNDKFCEISGYSRAELIGQDHRIVNSDYHLKAFFKDMYSNIARGRVWRGEICNRAKDGRIYWVDTTIVPFKNEEDRVMGYVAIRADITERKAVESEIERVHMQLTTQNRRLLALTEQAHRFVDDVSHEFRTPLAVIKEFGSIIADGLAGSITPEQAQYLGIIDNAVLDLNQMVEDFLDSSKLRAGRLRVDRRPQNVTDLFARIRPGLLKKAASRSITIEERIEPGLPRVFADEEKVRRVIMNLATNAVKFSPEGSRIELWARLADDDSVEIGVTDQGRGLEPEDQKKLFERFARLPSAGTPSVKGFGLGLNIARQLVWLNLGSMHVRSELGRGSTFSFTLPADEPRMILERFCARIAECEEPATRLAVISVMSDDETKSVDALRLFLAATTRPTDVILELPATQGVGLLVFGPTDSPEGWAARLSEARDRVTANTPGLARLRINILGTFTFPSQASDMTACALEHLTQESDLARTCLDR